LPEHLLHCVAIGDPECLCHELFAELRIGMVTANPRDESVIRGISTASPWSVAAISVGIVKSGAVVMSRELLLDALDMGAGSAARGREFAAAAVRFRLRMRRSGLQFPMGRSETSGDGLLRYFGIIEKYL
jgi:hypothetical protein